LCAVKLVLPFRYNFFNIFGLCVSLSLTALSTHNSHHIPQLLPQHHQMCSNFLKQLALNFTNPNMAVMYEAIRKLPLTFEQFTSACEPLKDLPAQNGYEEWSALISMLKQIADKEIELQVFLVGHVSVELSQSPLFEILQSPATTAKPPANHWKFMKLSFAAEDFLSTCYEMEQEANVWDMVNNGSYNRFISMCQELAKHEINILDFLSSEATDAMLETCSLLCLVLHTSTRSSGLGVFVDVDAIIKALTAPLGWLEKRHVPPYPPSPYGLSFDQTHLLQWMQAAELDIAEFSFQNPIPTPSFYLLHVRVHELGGAHTNVELFMARHKPVDGTPGSIMYRHLVNSNNEDGYQLYVVARERCQRWQWRSLP
jgi:hypothetical protein